MTPSTPSGARFRPWMPRVALACCCCLLAACLSLPQKSPSRPAPAPAAKPAATAPKTQPVAPKPQTPQTPAPQGACLVLALPDSGAFAPFAERIRSGAAVAQQELARAGYPVEIKAVNAAQPEWIAQLDALPPQCAVVGGPLQAQNYAAAKTAGATSRRAFFAFLPQLPAGDEGVTAWRFFPGPMDQITALLHFTRQELGIQDYAALYPSDAYGARMAGLFEQAVRSGGGLVRSASYPPADLSQWTQAAATLVQPRMVNKVPLPTATFGAIFLPDSWKNMDMLMTSLLYNGEDRQVLLGTSLWEQSLAGQTVPNAQNYALAVFPGAWNPALVPPALQALPNHDFWVGLGYDFVRFGASLALDSSASPAAVNSRIQQAQHMAWAMAPMSWDGRGQAQQRLFLFTPTATGMAPVDVAAFKERRAQVLTRFENRSRAAAQGK